LCGRPVCWRHPRMVVHALRCLGHSWCSGIHLANAALLCIVQEPGTDCLLHFDDRRNLRCSHLSVSSRRISSSTKVVLARHLYRVSSFDVFVTSFSEFDADYKCPDWTQLTWIQQRLVFLQSETSHRASTNTGWHFAFGAIRICSVRGYKLTYVCVVIATIANPPNSAQLQGTLTISPSYIRVRAVLWQCGERQTDRHTYTQTAVANIHFASAMPHTKCNKPFLI